MTPTDVGVSLKDCEPRYRETVVQMLRSQAWRELSAAQLFGHGLQFVSDLRTLKFISRHVQEETDHYAAVAELYQKHVGESIEPWVTEKLATKPIPWASSFLELGIAQWLYDRGGFWQLKEYEGCSFLPYRKTIEKIIKEEKGHQALGEKIVVELTRTGQFDADKQRVFEKWLRQGLLSFGRPATDGAAYSISVGLRKRDPGAVMQDFLDDIKPAVKACGLTLPKMDKIGIVEPAGGLDLSLHGVDVTKAEGYQA